MSPSAAEAASNFITRSTARATGSALAISEAPENPTATSRLSQSGDQSPHSKISTCRKSPRPSVSHSLRLSILLALLLFPALANARINLVPLPGRDSVQLTIYNSADLTLVKETRSLTFRKGLNKLEFSWANTLIDPTSVEIRPLEKAEEIEVLGKKLRAIHVITELSGASETMHSWYVPGIGLVKQTGSTKMTLKSFVPGTK